jgi:hypothetical protein
VIDHRQCLEMWVWLAWRISSVFCQKKRKNGIKNLFNQDKLNQIAFLADMFGLLNQLSLQGHSSSIIDLYDKIKSFQVKVVLWLSELEGKKTYISSSGC